MLVIVSLGTGAMLFSVGVVAEYIGVAVNMAMGRPLYLIVSDPADGPLGALPPPPRQLSTGETQGTASEPMAAAPAAEPVTAAVRR